MECYDCHRQIDDDNGEQYAVLWITEKRGLCVAFLCLPCSNKPEYNEFDPLADC